MSRTLHGTVEVQVGERTLVLQPTLKAVRAIESHFGGLRAASEGLRAVGLSAVTIVLAAGAGLEERDTEGFAEEVWQHGAAELIPAATQYLYALYNPRGGDSGKGRAATASAP